MSILLPMSKLSLQIRVDVYLQTTSSRRGLREYIPNEKPRAGEKTRHAQGLEKREVPSERYTRQLK
jgi:hypothetical protein